MKAYGLQKMTLLDFPGKVACTVFTGGCNLRCPFCHNAGLVTDIDDTAVYTEEEILKFLSGRKGLLDGVAITGGEPLLQPDIIDFIKKVRNLGFA
ncbi:MAG: radical SAM protein, partial [Clostridia bacterium]|nr:radical SAM protein [Clostridia bacterium]